MVFNVEWYNMEAEKRNVPFGKNWIEQNVNSIECTGYQQWDNENFSHFIVREQWNGTPSCSRCMAVYGLHDRDIQ